MATTVDRQRYQGTKQKYEIDWLNGPDDDILTFVTQRLENRDYYKKGLEQRWLRILACYEGFFYYDYDTALRRFMNDVDMPSWRKRLAINLMLPIVRQAATKYLKNRPIWDVTPASGNIEDINTASESKKFLQSYWYRYNINYQFIDLLLWLALTGNAYAYIYWDADAGPKHKLEVKDFIDIQLLSTSVHNEEQFAILLQDAQQKFQEFVSRIKTDKIPLGETQIEIVSPFDIIHPYSDDFQKIPWCMRTQVRDISYYAERGMPYDQMIDPAPKDMRFAYYTRRINNILNLSFGPDGLGTDSFAADDKDILEVQFWLAASPSIPEGYACVIAGGVMVHRGKNPYEHGEIPIIHFTEQKTPNKITGFSKAEQALPLIESYTDARTQVNENRQIMAFPKVLSPRSANILESAWTSAPGEIVEYTGNVAPTPWVPPSMPRYVFDAMSLDRRDMDDITARRDATKGYNPPGVRSGIMLENLQAQDEGELAITSLILDTGFSRMGRLVLATSDQFIRENRNFSFLGEKGRLESVSVGAGTLSGKTQGADYYNVRVTQYSQFGLSRAGQLEFLKVLLQYNVFIPQDRAKILQFISMGYFADEIDEYKVDRNNAHLENLQMAQGVPVMPNVAEHFTTHKEEHKTFMKTNWARLSPQAQQIMVMHLRMTEFFEVAELVKPEILALKAKIVLGQQEGVLPFLFGETNGTDSGSKNGSSSSSGGNKSSSSSGASRSS